MGWHDLRGARVRVVDPRSWATAVALAATGSAAMVAAAVGGRGGERFHWETVLALSLCAAVAEMQGTRLSGRLVVSAGVALSMLAAVTVGPLGAALVGLAAMVGDARPPLLRWISYAGIYVASGVAGGFAALAVGPIDDARDWQTLAAQSVVAAAAVFLVNYAGNVVIAVARRIRPLRQHLRMVLFAAGSGAFFATPIVVALAYGYERANLLVLLFSLVPLLAANALMRLYAEKTVLAERFAEGNMALAFALIRALDARDAYTAGHSAAVAVYARDLAAAAGYSPQQVGTVQLAALLHDVGKIGVPTEVLNKPGHLDDDEWLEIQRHPSIGERIAGEASMFQEVARVIRHHHERPDGSGYPDHLRGSDIPEASAIIGLADAYNAMTQSRSYRSALPPERAIEELRRGAGTQFQSRLVDLFVAILHSKGEAYRLAAGPEFSLDGQRRAIMDEQADRSALLAEAAA